MSATSASPRARVILLCGPSGSGKTRLADRSGLPVLHLDDFYRDGTDPGLPASTLGIVDWDDPRSWDRPRAMAALSQLCATGSAQIPVYDISRSVAVGTRSMDLGASVTFVADGIFAVEVVRECGDRGILATGICLRQNRYLTFVRRLVRDLKERRKPPWVLLRRGIALLRAEPAIVAHAVSAGCAAMTPGAAEALISTLAQPAAAGSD